MPALILPRRFTQQPQGPVEVDYSNPLARNIVCAYVSDSFAPTRNVVQNSGIRELTVVGGALPTGSQKGLCYALNGSSQYLTNTNNSVATKLPLTFSIIVWNNGIGEMDRRIFDVSTGVTANNVIGIRISQTGVFAAQHYDGGTQGQAEGPIVTGRFVHLVAVFESLTSRKIYQDGVLVGTNSTSVVAPNGINRVTIGYAPWSNSEYFNGSILAPTIFTRAFSEAEVFALYQNPWQLFKPRRQVLYFSTGSATIPTLSSPGVTNILTTSATPQVTLTF